MSTTEVTVSDIPENLYDHSTGKRYRRSRFFGKGGFAKCYEIIDLNSNEVYAGKIVSKKLMMKHNQKDKMTQEIAIHKSLKHKNIVKFYSFFDDPQNVYIVLELCKKRSMMELHKRRKLITEFECRYYIHQIITGVKFLHDHRIIHRDLKLGNIFLNDELHIKIGDFGLATRVEFDGERKKTLCGTPNYIAPEILSKKGHSYEVDIWSIGCVMYTLLVGQPPFETKSLRDTYSKIKKCEYKIPNFLRKNAADMIIAMLQSNPEKRPTAQQLLRYDFITCSGIPTSLPTSCLTMAPRTDLLASLDRAPNRSPLREKRDNNNYMQVSTAMGNDTKLETTFLKNHLYDQVTASGQICHNNNREYLNEIENLREQLSKLMQSKNIKISNSNNIDENTDPAAQPLFWISKWVDYSDKYGFGYQLCDEGMGVMFNDTTKLIMLSNERNVHFIDKQGKETYFTVDSYPPSADKKMKLLSYFKRYMTEHLVKAGADAVVLENDCISRIPHLHAWFRTTCAVVMHLTNGTVQFNFVDHMKIILCPKMSAVTYMDSEKNFRTFRFANLSEHGIPKELYAKLRYALEKLNTLKEKLS